LESTTTVQEINSLVAATESLLSGFDLIIIIQSITLDAINGVFELMQLLESSI
jgi:hypothetical protein